MKALDAAALRRQAIHASLAACADTVALADVLAAALLDAVGGRRSHCVFHDADAGELWQPERPGQWPVGAGLVGATVALGRPMRVARSREAASFVAALDDPHPRRADELLLVPIGPVGGPIEAVIVLARECDDPSWDDTAIGVAEREAAEVARGLTKWKARERDAVTMASGTRGPSEPAAGPPLRLLSPGLGGVWLASVVLFVAALAVAPFIRLNRYSTGIAIVREPTRTEVLTLAAGDVAGVHVRPGQHVDAGDPLVSLHDALARAELVRLERAWADELRRHLLTDTPTAAGSTLAVLRDQIDQARDRLRRTVVRAPRSGRIGELRVALDQPVAVGERILALVDGDSAPELVAMMPAGDIDRFAPGQVLRYSPAGHPRSHIDVVVKAVDPVVVGPTEARRSLGGRMADAVPLDGAVAILMAPLPQGGFVIDDTVRAWQDGMIGRAELQIGSDSLIDLLLPLKELR